MDSRLTERVEGRPQLLDATLHAVVSDVPRRVAAAVAHQVQADRAVRRGQAPRRDLHALGAAREAVQDQHRRAAALDQRAQAHAGGGHEARFALHNGHVIRSNAVATARRISR